ncbi:MAG: hypothetical protein AAF567_24810 [Actinomycetota bacterium]
MTEIEANAINATRGVLALWPLVPIIGLIISLVTGNAVWVIATGVLFLLASPWAWPRLRLQWMWRTPRLQVASTPFHLGEEVAFTYVRASRKPLDVGAAILRCTITCTENVQWETGSGKNRQTHSDSQTVYKADHTALVAATMEGLEARGTFTIPIEAGGPSLRLSDNQIVWEIEAWLEGERLPTCKESFDIEVAPIVATAARPRPQDDVVGPSAFDNAPTANPFIHIDDDIVELGDSLQGHATYRPDPDETAEVRGLRLTLDWRTSGRGDTDGGEIQTVSLPTNAAGRVDTRWHIPMPTNVPVSYQGNLIRIEYTLHARLDRRLARDETDAIDIVVTPQHGRHLG